MSILRKKRALILGIASERSIAFGIARAFHEQGAELALTYQNEKLQSRVQRIANTLGAICLCDCDVSSDQAIDNTFSELKQHWQNFDIVVHAIAYAPTDQLSGRFIDVVHRDGFQIAHDISSYSFAAVAKAAMPMLNPNAALLTLSYLGAERSLPAYNVMGLAKASLEACTRFLAFDLGQQAIRVNAISAGPIKTLAASGIKGLKTMLTVQANQAPLKRSVTIEEVGNAASFLCSDLASGITGEILHVDAGFHSTAMANID